MNSSVSIPMDEVSPEALGGCREVLVICQSGGRSARVCRALAEKSFLRAVNVNGGTSAWEAAGLPVERGEGTIPVERQTRIIIGTLVILGVLPGVFVHLRFL